MFILAWVWIVRGNSESVIPTQLILPHETINQLPIIFIFMPFSLSVQLETSTFYPFHTVPV